jgi:hypothetical protein
VLECGNLSSLSIGERKESIFLGYSFTISCLKSLTAHLSGGDYRDNENNQFGGIGIISSLHNSNIVIKRSWVT